MRQGIEQKVITHALALRLTPDGFRFTNDVAQFSGFHKFCENFPYDFVEKKASERESGLSMAYIAISKVSDQIQSRVFSRPLAHKVKLDLVKNRLSRLPVYVSKECSSL